MMYDIFLPEVLLGRRILTKRRIAISPDAYGVGVVTTTLSRTETQVHTAQFQPAINATEPLVAQLKRLAPLLPPHDQLHAIIPSSMVVLKGLTLPLLDPQKIEQIIDFEVEPLLPFPLSEATVDFSITAQSAQEQISCILAVAIHNRALIEIIDQYHQAGLVPTVISVDLLALYELYRHIPAYASIPDGAALINIGPTSVTIGLIINGALRRVHSIPRGIEGIIEAIATESKRSIKEISQIVEEQQGELTKQGAIQAITRKHLLSLVHDMSFTLNSLSLKLSFYRPISKLILAGHAMRLCALPSIIEEILQTPAALFSIDSLFNDKIRCSSNLSATNWVALLAPFGAAISTTPLHQTNVRKKEFAPDQAPLHKARLLAAAGLTSSIFFSIILFGSLQLYSLYHTASRIEQAAVDGLHAILERNPQAGGNKRQAALLITSLEPLLQTVRIIISQEKQTWGDLTRLNTQPLFVLADLTSGIDRSNFSINIQSIDMRSEIKNGTRAVVEGTLTSKTEQDFQDYERFISQLIEHNTSTHYLAFKSEDSDQGDNGVGVKYTLTFQQKASI